VWATTMMPPPSAVSLRVTLVDPETGPEQEIALSCDQLGLDPFGLVRMASDPGELRQRIALLARQRWAAGPRPAATGAVRIENGDGTYGLDDLIAAAGAVGAMLQQARAVGADDLTGPTEPSAAPAADTTQRVAAVEVSLNITVSRLDSAAAMTDPLEVADVLLVASGWGVAGATPSLDQDVPTLAALQSQALRAAEELRHRLDAEPFQPDPGDPAVTL